MSNNVLFSFQLNFVCCVGNKEHFDSFLLEHLVFVSVNIGFTGFCCFVYSVYSRHCFNTFFPEFILVNQTQVIFNLKGL
jgi:hypothetical protein